MKRRVFFILFVLGFTGSLPGWAQWISPGKLSRVHQDLEGVTQCRKCHALGRGPSTAKCLACHEAVARDLKTRSGYHGRVTAGRKCWTCHHEHRGLRYQPVRLNEKTFKHRLTDFPLTGAHRQVSCKTCHQSKKYRDTPHACRSCHQPKHGDRFGPNCKQCHTTETWSSVKFDHHRTRFPLKGLHQKVACLKCHQNRFR